MSPNINQLTPQVAMIARLLFSRAQHAQSIPTLLFIILGASLFGCSGTGPLTDGRETDTNFGYSQSEETTPSWLPDEPLDSLDQALNAANPFVYTNTVLPHELAIRILQLCNLEQNWESFDATWQSANPTTMRAGPFARFSLALLNGLWQQQRYDEATRWLNSAVYLQKFPTMASNHQVALSLFRANQLEQSGKPLESAKERLFVHDFITDKAQRFDNHQRIWQSLLATHSNDLVSALENNQYRELHPWLSLATIIQDFQQPAAKQASAIARWKNQWPRHAANQFVPKQDSASNTLASTLFGTRPNNRLGIFLPLSGTLASAGHAVRDGILTAYFESLSPETQSGYHKPAPAITFYDTHQADIDALYTRAISEGVSTVIGPLQKQHVRALFTMPTNIPIITLNYVAQGLPPTDNIVQFGLAAEDEASQLAQQARRQGYQQPLVLVSQKGWSKRAADAFRHTWMTSGGATPVVQIMTERSHFSDEVADALRLPQSTQRHSDLQNATAHLLDFTPRRRQDVDVIILLVNDQDARAINPLLAYHYAADLPVMASSYVHGAHKDTGYSDLNGIVFSELPWLLPQANSRTQISKGERRLLKSKTQKRLYAMGQDAFHLSSRLEQLIAAPEAQWSANTGQLSIRNNRVIRETPLAKFQQGRVIAIKNQEITDSE